MGTLDLVIFDCDGVLVDSERLAVRTEAAILTELGWPISEAEVIERFVGRSAAAMHREVEEHLGRPVDWDLEFESPCRTVFEKELAPVPGVVEVLRHIKVPVCVASSGTHERMQFTLGLTGLWDRFEGLIFSVDDVAEGKPAPDIFLHAAASMQVAPRRCAVVEDSVSGVRAGLAAGMAVFAFAGGVTDARELTVGDAVVFGHMRELSALLAPLLASSPAGNLTGNMDTSATVSSAVHDEVAEVLMRYATGIDRREWDLFRTCFTEDCDADYGDIGAWRGVGEVTAWMEETHAACGLTRHQISNVAVVWHPDGVQARCDVDALVMGPDNVAGTQATGYYDDVLIRRSDGWHIARRRFTLVSVQPVTRPAGD